MPFFREFAGREYFLDNPLEKSLKDLSLASFSLGKPPRPKSLPFHFLFSPPHPRPALFSCLSLHLGPLTTWLITYLLTTPTFLYKPPARSQQTVPGQEPLVLGPPQPGVVFRQNCSLSPTWLSQPEFERNQQTNLFSCPILLLESPIMVGRLVLSKRPSLRSGLW